MEIPAKTLRRYLHYGYACHEGNYGLPGIMTGARILNTQAATR